VSTVWWVNHSDSYDDERRGGFISAPKAPDENSPFHELLHGKLRAGDATIHFASGEIRAVGVVRDSPHVEGRPAQMPGGVWVEQRRIANVDYHDLAHPISLNEISERDRQSGPFDNAGSLKGDYLVALKPTFATALYKQFASRWPIAWMPTATAPRSGWDEFIYWAKRFKEWPGFDGSERDYKLSLAERLAVARRLFLEGNDEWVEAFRKAITSKDNNFTTFHLHSPFLEWTKKNPDDARLAIGHLWDEPLVEISDAVEEFASALVLPKKSGKSGLITLASVLLMGVDPRTLPPYRKSPYVKSYDLTGYERPPEHANRGGIYAHGLAFLDSVVSEAASRGLALRDRLDAQSVLWAISQENAIDEWSDEDKARLNAFVTQSQPPALPPEPPTPPTTPTPPKKVDIDSLARELHLDADYLRRIQRLLEHKQQVIFYGPPGTGKTYVAKRLAQLFAATGGVVETVQFHPSYAYEDFVEGYRPRLTNGQAGFALVHGPLRRIADAAAKASGTCMLLIDEINRGNVAKVFGELYYLLEYRNERISLQYSEEPVSLPKNLWIIGTMNTADRSIALVDAALRRRFHFVPFYPDRPPVQGLLRRWLTDNKPDLLWLADVVDRANEELGSNHLAIGPSHFLRSDLNEEWIGMIWEHSVLPYIAEQYFGDDSRLEAFALAKLRQPKTTATPIE
jgi:5-methylcytosine-specific restriction enzyme B